MSVATLLIALSTVFSGLILGSVFALVAAGVTIVYGSIWMPNAANGQFFLLAGLLAWSLTTCLGLNPALAALIVLALGMPFAYLLESTLIRRFYDVPERNIAYFVVTLGLTQILSGLFSVTYGRWSDQFNLPPVLNGITFIGPFPMANNRILVLAIAASLWRRCWHVAASSLWPSVARRVPEPRSGGAPRRQCARHLSPVLHTRHAGDLRRRIFYAMAYTFDLTVAWTMAITAFAIMIVGGPGSVLGALVIGMVFGFTQAGVSVFASPTVATFSYLGAMLLILLLKPSGLFAR